VIGGFGHRSSSSIPLPKKAARPDPGVVDDAPNKTRNQSRVAG
jgi:hypothetical protein